MLNHPHRFLLLQRKARPYGQIVEGVVGCKKTVGEGGVSQDQCELTEKTEGVGQHKPAMCLIIMERRSGNKHQRQGADKIGIDFG